MIIIKIFIEITQVIWLIKLIKAEIEMTMIQNIC